MHRITVQVKARGMKVTGYAGVLVTGVGLSIYLRNRLKHHAFAGVYAQSADDVVLQTSSSTNLKLKQVQIFFRHGARTPLNMLEGYKQAQYLKDFHMQPHQSTLFPLERIDHLTKKSVDWGTYEYHMRRKDRMRGGLHIGQLTSFGQEQMYSLGLRIREAYQDQLPLNSYSPDTTFLLSTNVTRTVESARCVLAGIFGSEELNRYAASHGPLRFFVTESSPNLLVPDTRWCKVLQDVNHAAMLHFDFNEHMKVEREEMERYIDEKHDEHQRVLAKAQEKLNTHFASISKDKKGQTKLSFNSDRQLVNHDSVLSSLLRHRDSAINQVDSFWQNVISNHPVFADCLTKDERSALSYLQRIEIEEFTLTTSSGYRYKFHFESNPYFHNKTLCKEIVYLQGKGSGTGSISSKSTSIKWKEGNNLYHQHKSHSHDGNSSKASVFCWYLDPVHEGEDTIGTALKEEIWRNPLDFYKHVSYAMDHSTTKKINFVYLRDDLIAREFHGWSYSPDLLRFRDLVERNATKMLYQSMTGRHKRERPTVTKLAIGRLLVDMVGWMEACMKGECQTQLILYSSHDSTMTSLMESLGIWDHTWPPFGSDVRLELYEDLDSKENYVRLIYNDEVKKVRGCQQTLVKFSDFVAAIKSYMIDAKSFEKICASNFLEEVAKDVLVHEQGEKLDDEASVMRSEIPAGM